MKTSYSLCILIVLVSCLLFEANGLSKVGQVWLRDFQNEGNTAVITHDGKFLLVGTVAFKLYDLALGETTSTSGIPGTVVKIDTSSGLVVGQAVLSALSTGQRRDIRKGIIDPASEYAYFGANDWNGSIFKLRIADMFVNESVVYLDNPVTSMILGLSNTITSPYRDHAFVSDYNGRVFQMLLGDLFSQENTVKMSESGDGNVRSNSNAISYNFAFDPFGRMLYLFRTAFADQSILPIYVPFNGTYIQNPSIAETRSCLVDERASYNVGYEDIVTPIMVTADGNTIIICLDYDIIEFNSSIVFDYGDPSASLFSCSIPHKNVYSTVLHPEDQWGGLEILRYIPVANIFGDPETTGQFVIALSAEPSPSYPGHIWVYVQEVSTFTPYGNASGYAIPDLPLVYDLFFHGAIVPDPVDSNLMHIVTHSYGGLGLTSEVVTWNLTVNAPTGFRKSLASSNNVFDAKFSDDGTTLSYLAINNYTGDIKLTQFVTGGSFEILQEVDILPNDPDYETYVGNSYKQVVVGALSDMPTKDFSDVQAVLATNGNPVDGYVAPVVFSAQSPFNPPVNFPSFEQGANIYDGLCGARNPYDGYFYYSAYWGYGQFQILVRFNPNNVSDVQYSQPFGYSYQTEFPCYCVVYAYAAGSMVVSEACWYIPYTTYYYSYHNHQMVDGTLTYTGAFNYIDYNGGYNPVTENAWLATAEQSLNSIDGTSPRWFYWQMSEGVDSFMGKLDLDSPNMPLVGGWALPPNMNIVYLDIDLNNEYFFAPTSVPWGNAYSGSYIFEYKISDIDSIPANASFYGAAMSLNVTAYPLILETDVQTVYWRMRHPTYNTTVFYVVKYCYGGTVAQPSSTGECPVWLAIYNSVTKKSYGPWKFDEYIQGLWVQPEDAHILSLTEEYLILQNYQPYVITHKIKSIYNATSDEWDVEYLLGTYDLPRFLVGFDHEFSGMIDGQPMNTLLFSRGNHNPNPGYFWSGEMFQVDPANLTIVGDFVPMHVNKKLRWDTEVPLDAHLYNGYFYVVNLYSSIVKYQLNEDGSFEWVDSVDLPIATTWVEFNDDIGVAFFVQQNTLSSSAIQGLGSYLGYIDLDSMKILTKVWNGDWFCFYGAINSEETIMYSFCSDSAGIDPQMYVLAFPLPDWSNAEQRKNFPFGAYQKYQMDTTADYIVLGSAIEKSVDRYLYGIVTTFGAVSFCQVVVFDLRVNVENPALPFPCSDPVATAIHLFLDETRKNMFLESTVQFEPYYETIQICSSPYTYPLFQKFAIECPPGYHRDSVNDICSPVPAGYYTPTDGFVVPIPCPVTTYTPTPGFSSCLDCPAGTYGNDTGLSVCSNCSMGYYSTGAALQCRICDAGTYSSPENDRCINCAEGTFCGDPGCSVCQRCQAGNVALGLGSSRCTTCNPGQIPNENATACINCPAGYSSEEGDSMCTICPPGSVSVSGGRCTLCDVGTVPSNDSTTCDQCPKGYFAGSQGLTQCQACNEGYFASVPKSSACQQCPSGQFTGDKGTIECPKCPDGTFSSDPGATECTTCPSGSYAIGGGATSCTPCPSNTVSGSNSSYCMCQADFYGDTISVTNSDQCFACPVGGVCPGGTIVTTFEGYWRTDPSSLTFYPCPQTDSCLGGENSECSAGYTGTLCGVCAKGYGSKGNHCVKCSSGVSAVAWFVFIVLFGLFMGLMFRKPGRKHSMFSKVKILVSFLQVLSQSNTNYLTSWPDQFVSLVSFLSLVNLDVLKMTSMDCILNRHITFYQGYLFQVLLPIVLCVFVGLVFFLWIYLNRRGMVPTFFRSFNENMVIDMLVRNEMFILVLLYPGTSTKILALFKCQKIGNDWFQEDDYTIQCYTPLWNSYLVGTSIMIVFWIFGIPAAFIALLIKFRSQLDEDNIRSRFGFLYYQYKLKYFYWEIIELIRRLFLTAIVIFVGRGTPTQFVIADLISFIAVVAQLCVLPFVIPGDNWIHLASLIAIYFTLFYGLLERLNALSQEQGKRDFLVFLLMFVNIAAIGSIVLYILLVLQKKAAKYYGKYTSKKKGALTAESSITPNNDDTTNPNAVQLSVL